MKDFVLLVLTGSIAISGRAAQPAAEAAGAKAPRVTVADLFGDSVVAKGKGFEIKRSQVDDGVSRWRLQLGQRAQGLPPDQVRLMEQRVLNDLIQLQLLLGKTTDADKELGKTQANKMLDDERTRLGSEEAFNRELKIAGSTREEMLAKLADNFAANAVAQRELKITVSDADAKKFYDENPAKFEQPEMVRVSHILLATRDPKTNAELAEDQKAAKHKKAEDLLKRAKAGEEFTKLADEFSEDPGVKQNHGEYKFSRDDPLVPEFKAAAFALSSNQVSDIVTSQFGYHILKLSERIPAKKLELDKVLPAVKASLTNQAAQTQFPALIEKLKKEAAVAILDEKLKPKTDEGASGLPPGHPPVQPQAKPEGK